MRRTCKGPRKKMYSISGSPDLSTIHAMNLRGALLATLVCAVSACTSNGDAADTTGSRMADREAVEATLARYTRGLDRLDAQLYVSSFAPDGVLMIYAKSYRGHEALRSIVAEELRLRQAQRDSGQPSRTLFHFETNSTVEFPSRGKALHQAYWLTANRTGEKPEDLTVLGVGSSSDELQKIDGKWLITRREIRGQP